MIAFLLNAQRSRHAAFSLALPLLLGGCGGIPFFPDDPFNSPGEVLWMGVINETDRYGNAFIDKYWAGNFSDHSHGGGVCCYPGLKKWTQPVTVEWIWGNERDEVTREITVPRESHSTILHFPKGGPHRGDSNRKRDRYLCVILRDIDKAELMFSPHSCGFDPLPK